MVQQLLPSPTSPLYGDQSAEDAAGLFLDREAVTDRVVAGELDDKKLQATEKRMRHANQATVDRTLALRLLLAELRGVSFEEAADLLDVRPTRLRGWLHETESMPAGKEARVAELLECVRLLHGVVKHAATGWWFHLPIPALGARTPLDAIREGDLELVVSVVKSYLEPVFV